MKYDKIIIELANKFKMKPDEIQAFSDIFDFIDGFSFVKNHIELEQLCFENYVNGTYIYKEVPYATKEIIIKFLDKGLSVSNFFCPLNKNKNLEKFIKRLIDTKTQPKAFFEEGILTYKHLKREPKIDHTIEIVRYDA